eukprot:2258220-Rhodomonas_salina.1
MMVALSAADQYDWPNQDSAVHGHNSRYHTLQQHDQMVNPTSTHRRVNHNIWHPLTDRCCRLLIPVECQITSGQMKEKSLSSYIHHEPGRCTPWGLPEIIIVVPTIFLTSMYMGFALIASYFSLEPNCLSCHPNARFTGNVEVVFLITKISTTCLVYAAKGVSPLATS